MITARSIGLLDPPCVMRSKGYTPLPNSFVGYRDSTFSKQILDVAKTECESMIEPHGTRDDVGWKTISTIAEFLFHTHIVVESWVT